MKSFDELSNSPVDEREKEISKYWNEIDLLHKSVETRDENKPFGHDIGEDCERLPICWQWNQVLPWPHVKLRKLVESIIHFLQNDLTEMTVNEFTLHLL